tara:strand:+ start:387 stop:1145 length:759 start_codon:yes stop_codon:yes gene_type:complete
MAHKLYYSIDGYYDSTVVAAGSFDQSDNSFTVTDGSQVTNEANINSNSISDAAISSFGTNDVIRVDFGVTKTIDFIANYHSVADTNDLYFYSSNSSAASYSNRGNINSSAVGWNVTEFTEATNRYWALRSQDGAFDGMHEVIMGAALDIGQPEVGNTENEQYNTVYNKAYNGTQYSNKIDKPFTEWTIKLPIIDTTLKSALDTFQSTVQNKFKFIYNDGSSNHYVRLVAPITYVLLAPLVYTATIKLKESFE